MTAAQLAAVRKLEKALDNAHAVGLRGGVYENSLRVWPDDGPNPSDAVPSSRFFDEVEKYGATCQSKMVLDGGSGW